MAQQYHYEYQSWRFATIHVPEDMYLSASELPMEKVSACVIFQPVDARFVLSLTFFMAKLTACGIYRVIVSSIYIALCP